MLIIWFTSFQTFLLLTQKHNKTRLPIVFFFCFCHSRIIFCTLWLIWKSRYRYNLLKKIGVWLPIVWLYWGVWHHVSRLDIQGLGRIFSACLSSYLSTFSALLHTVGLSLACICRPFALGLLLGFSSFSAARRLEGRCTAEVRVSRPPDSFLRGHWGGAACLSCRSHLRGQAELCSQRPLQLGDFSLPLSASGLAIGWLPAVGGHKACPHFVKESLCYTLFNNPVINSLSWYPEWYKLFLFFLFSFLLPLATAFQLVPSFISSMVILSA